MPRSWQQRRRRNIGNKARRNLPLLLIQHNHQCYWCKKPIVMLRSVPEELIITIDHGTIIYRDGDDVVQTLIASVDHLVSLLEGGTNEMDNLVPSCRYCNEDRGRETEREILYPCRNCSTETH